MPSVSTYLPRPLRRVALFAAVLAAFSAPTALADQSPLLPVSPDSLSAPTVAGALALRRALELSARYNAALAAEQWTVRSAQGAALDAGRRLNPTASLTAENVGGSLGVDQAETTFELGQTLELGGDRHARAAVAEARLRQALAEFDVAGVSLADTLISAFLDTWLAQERALRLAESEELARLTVESAAARVRAGAASPLERLRTDGEYAARRAERARAMADLVQARRSLALLWGNTDATYDSLQLASPPTASPPSLDSLSLRLVAHPEQAVARSELAVNEALVRQARASRLPDLDVSAGVRQLAESGRNTFVVGVAIPLPLWNRQRGAVVSAEADLAASRWRARGTQADLEVRLRNARERVIAASRAYEDVRSALLPTARQALTVARAGYRAGRFSYIEVLDAERSALDAELAILEAEHDLWSARFALVRLAGLPLPLAETEETR